MPEMPIPQDYNRFVEPVEGIDEKNEFADESIVELLDEQNEIEELPDEIGRAHV